MKNLIFLAVMLYLILPAYAQGTKYCHDPESCKEWDALVEKYPGNEDGSIQFDLARGAFKDLHETVYKLAQEAQQQWLKAPGYEAHSGL